MADEVAAENAVAARESGPSAELPSLTHLDSEGRARMVDVSSKQATARRAVAEAEVAMSHETLLAVAEGRTKKGEVLTVAEIAGVMAGKRTSELIPLCHPIPITDLRVSARVDLGRSLVHIVAEAATLAPTGVEMEAIVAASVAAVTVYDMVKGVERGVTINHVRLLSKSGGRTGEWRREAPQAGEASIEPGPGR